MDILSLIQFEDPSKNNGVIKATIHKTGKLGFSSSAQNFLSLGEESYFKIGFNDIDAYDNNIYLVPSGEDDQTFKAAKAGDYYYINLKHIFDKRGLDYQNETMIYDIKKQKSGDTEFFILTRRK